ncbi:MAG: antitoxin [Opitutaceae bacterium]
MAAVTAKAFQSGNSQALLIPKAFRLKSSTVKLIRTADGCSVYDEQARASRIRAFAALGGSCPDFPEVAGHQASNIKRDWD